MTELFLIGYLVVSFVCTGALVSACALSGMSDEMTEDTMRATHSRHFGRAVVKPAPTHLAILSPGR
jgi:hypothetical protein